MAIIGLLTETPDMTVAEVAEALKKRFAVCRFDASTARGSLLQMAEARRPRVRCTHRPPGRSRMQDRYRPTPLGTDEFNAWKFMQPIGIPALREALYGRIELCRLEDLPELIRMGREERDIATALFSDAKTKLTVHLELARLHRRQGEPGPEDLLREARGLVMHFTPERWSSRSLHFARLAKDLEDIAKRAGIDFPPDPCPEP